MKLLYEAFDKNGRAVSDVVEAQGIAEATDLLRREGLYVTTIGESKPGAGLKPAPGGAKLGKGKQLKNLAIFTRQLYVLASTGTPLVEALAALERQAKNAAWRDVVAGVRTNVEQGDSLSAAMGAYPNQFNAVCRGLIAAGESGGNLDAMLDRVAGLTRKQLHVRSAVLGALVYPCLLVVVALAVLGLLLTFVLPRFTQLFKTLDTPLPPTTQALMVLSDLTVAYWWSLPLFGGAAVITISWWLKTSAGKKAIDTVALKFPQIGPMTKNFATARITRLLGILLQGRVPLVEALNLTRDSMSNHHYASLMANASEVVTRGESLASVFRDTNLVTPSVYEAVRSGERSGQLGVLLATIADFLDEENEVTLRSLTSILEPMILIVLGVLVGFVALSMFMPLFDLTAATRGGN